MFSSINLAYPEQKRKRAISLLASAWILPALLAPVIAGYVTEVLDWHWVFLGMIPLAIIVCLFTQHRLADLSREAGAQGASEPPDLMLNTLRIAVGIGVFLAGLNWYADSWWLPVFLIAGGVMFVRPLLGVFPQGILTARPGLSAALALKGLLVYACIGSEAFLPAYLTRVFDYSTFQAGSVVTSGAATWILATWLYEVFGERYSDRRLLVFSTSVLFTGLLSIILLLALFAMPAWVYLAWAFVCFGMGMSYAIAVAAAMKHTDQGSEGATATGAGMVDAIGFSFASGIGGAVLNIAALYSLGVADAVPSIWLFNTLVAGIAVFVAWRRF